MGRDEKKKEEDKLGKYILSGLLGRVQSQAACSGKSMPSGYIPSPWLLAWRYWKKGKEVYKRERG